MKKIEPYVRTWYDNFEHGKITGVRCQDCGAVEYPPVPICNACGKFDMEWIEMKGTATMISVTESPMPSPFFPDAGPLIGGYITMDEGPTFMSWLVGVPPEERTSLFDRIPFKVEAEFYQHEGYQYPVFHIKAD
ncbi:MAG: OB-fold domain-containing protein [Propionibacteriaceae bacterium]|nr:OB-fold domain-containing protein [Propionibacteriaceae bacterium]